MVTHTLENLVEFLSKPLPAPIVPAFAQANGAAFKPHAPIRKVGNRDDRCIMSPMFEQMAVALQQRLEMLRPISLPAGKQNHVVRPLDRIDAVDLNKSEAFDEGVQRRTACRSCRLLRQRMAIEKKPARVSIGKSWQGRWAHANGFTTGHTGPPERCARICGKATILLT